MPEVCTIQARAVRKILSAASDAGVSLDSLYKATRLSPATVKDPDGRIPYSDLVALYERAAKLVGDDAFGLHVGERTELGEYDVLGYVAMNSPTVGEALNRLIRYYRIWTDGSVYDLEVDGSTARLIYRYNDCRVSDRRHECESSIASVVKFGRSYTGIDWAPLEVRFQHRQPEDLREHRRFLRSVIRFGEPENEIILERQMLELPLVKADAGLCAVLDRHAEELLARLPQESSLRGRVRQLLVEALRGGNPGLEAVSKQMGMSARTLQRKLKEEGTSHQEMLDEMRGDLSRRYLKEPEMAICEVAYLLGFSEPSAFHRAFRRWTGMTPGEYRRANRES